MVEVSYMGGENNVGAVALVVVFEIYATWSIFAEWDSIQSAEGTRAALSDAFGRVAFGLV